MVSSFLSYGVTVVNAQSPPPPPPPPSRHDQSIAQFPPPSNKEVQGSPPHQHAGPPPPGGGGSAPNSCSNKCDVNGNSADISFDSTSNSDFVLVTTNGCPSHMIENAIGDNPNSACKQTTETFYVPKVPVFRDTSSTLPNLNTVTSGIMVALSGAVIFGPATGSNGKDI